MRSTKNILSINGGSSSAKFALYGVGEPLERCLHGKGHSTCSSGMNLTFDHPTGRQPGSRSFVSDPDLVHQAKCNRTAGRNALTTAKEVD